MNNRIFSRIANQDRSCFRYTNFGYAIICAASSGFYQQRFWGMDSPGAPPLLMWLFVAAIGGSLLLIKEIKLNQKQQRSLLLVDALFIFPIIAIPLLPIRHDFALVLMLTYAVCFLLAYLKVYKKN